MRWMIASDVHGSAKWCGRLLQAYSDEGCQRLVLLGDLLYHGPRNDLPEGYAPREVIGMLNAMRARLLCVRGNCEAEVDQMVLEFPVLADYALLAFGETGIYCTHGHVFGEENPPPLCEGDVLLCGHTHVPKLAEHAEFVYLNPGSVAIPKADSAHSYMLFDGKQFIWKSLEDGAPFLSYRLR